MKFAMFAVAVTCLTLLCGCEAVGYSSPTGEKFMGFGLFTNPSVTATTGPNGARSVSYHRSNDLSGLGTVVGEAVRAYSGGVNALTPAVPAPVTSATSPTVLP